MPFKSRSQMRTCYGRQPKGWDCDKWLAETPSVCCIPECKGAKQPKTCIPGRQGVATVGPIEKGARGGQYRVIREVDARGKICEIRVYVRSRGMSKASGGMTVKQLRELAAKRSLPGRSKLKTREDLLNALGM